MLLKQFRLLFYWAHFVAFIVVLTVQVIETTNINEDKIYDAIYDYETCVKINGDDEDCTLDVEKYIVPFPQHVAFHVITGCFPISTFLVFGARRELLLFWKQYFVQSWKNKRLYLNFIPSFDPHSEVSVSDKIIDRAERRNTKILKCVNDL